MALEAVVNYPVYYAVTETNTVARWRPLADWAMAIPHFVVSYVVDIVGQFCTIISWFAILFTGKMPEGLANIIIMSQRYSLRVTGFFLGLTEQYPPFEFETITAADPGNYALRYDVRPELANRNRLTVAFRIFMVIPIAIFWYIVTIGAYAVAIVAWFAVLITGAYPVGMRSFVIKALRLGARVGAYGACSTDQYPPFAVE